MDGDYDLVAVAERTTLTPAERALLSEQGENARACLATFVKACQDDTPAKVITSMPEVLRHIEYISNVLNTKIAMRLSLDHEEGRGH